MSKINKKSVKNYNESLGIIESIEGQQSQTVRVILFILGRSRETTIERSDIKTNVSIDNDAIDEAITILEEVNEIHKRDDNTVIRI